MYLEDKQHIMKGDDVWVPTVCAGCYNCCGILAHRVNGTIVEVKGDPESPNTLGRICAKGVARTIDLQHPDRVLKCLKRTNPEKGPGVDPGWQEITWEEAMDTTVGKLKKIMDDDPRKLILSHFDIPGYRISGMFGAAFGTVNMHWNRADYCGSASHPAWLITNGTLNSEVDFSRCKYIVLWGTQLGHVVNTISIPAGSELAKARREGAKVVVIDPYCSHAASKADWWIPIKPGTDGALAIAMLHIMLHELEIWDDWFIKTQSNGCYLIQEDGHYLRDSSSNKPLVWDLADGKAKTFDDKSLEDPAIEGSYEVNGKNYRPSFQVIKDQMADVDVEEMARITTIPAEDIRQFTWEFCETANIGGTIDIDGHTLPLRPVGIDYKRGMASHKGGMNSCFAIHMLNLLVGACDVPGGQRGVNPHGPYWEAGMCDDGLLIPSDFIAKYNKPYPGRQAKKPQILDLQELFPAALFTRGLYPMGIDEPEKFGIDYKPEMMIHCRTNTMLNSHNITEMAETMKKIDFQVSICNFIDETCEFADIIFPDAHDYERWDMFPANDPYAFIAPGSQKKAVNESAASWYFLYRQAVAEAPGDAKPWTDIYLEFAERLGILEKIYEMGNEAWNLGDKYKLDPKKKYSVRDIAELQCRTVMGDDFGLDKYNEKSSYDLREKTVEEKFPRVFLPSRVPIYLEYFLGHKKDVQKIVDELKLDWDLAAYSPVPIWIPCEAHEYDVKYPLIATNCKVPTHQFSVTTENLWIDEIACASPYTYNITMHTKAAEELGLKTGDIVCVESNYGNKYEGRLQVTELLHPECVNCCGTFGHYAKGMPVSRKKGVQHNELLPKPNLDRIDILSGQIDMCVRVKVYKVEE
ncbi:molybdopterin-dependent oxidoreductase [Spirochaetota bacterium]